MHLLGAGGSQELIVAAFEGETDPQVVEQAGGPLEFEGRPVGENDSLFQGAWSGSMRYGWTDRTQEPL